MYGDFHFGWIDLRIPLQIFILFLDVSQSWIFYYNEGRDFEYHYAKLSKNVIINI